MHGNVLGRSVMLTFAMCNFFIIDNQRGILSKFDNYLAVHEEPERITYVRTYRSACKRFSFFPLIDTK